jgi:hypothetical protein
MKVVELYGRVRYAVQIEGLSRRGAARQFGIDPPDAVPTARVRSVTAPSKTRASVRLGSA